MTDHADALAEALRQMKRSYLALKRQVSFDRFGGFIAEDDEQIDDVAVQNAAAALSAYDEGRGGEGAGTVEPELWDSTIVYAVSGAIEAMRNADLTEAADRLERMSASYRQRYHAVMQSAMDNLTPEDIGSVLESVVERSSAAALAEAEADVLVERKKQRERWGDAHDDAEHRTGGLALAASVYARRAGMRHSDEWCEHQPMTDWEKLWWPWDRKYWKPRGRRRTLVKAAAMLLAEIERLDRAAGGEDV